MLNVNMFVVFTGNRFNQILIFQSWEEAAEWLRSSTHYTEAEIARAIKTPSWDGRNFLSVFEV